MGPRSGSTKPPARAPQILAPVGVDQQPLKPQSPFQRRVTELVDRLAGEVVLRHCNGQRVLDLGHGAPTVTQWVERRAATLTVVDAIDLGRREDVRLPFREASFDLVYCLRTLPHLGRDEQSSEAAARSAMAEVERVLLPGGTALVQIDNPRSLWGVYHGIRNPMTAVESGPMVLESDRGITRFDTLGRFVGFLPPLLTLTGLHGLRVVTAIPHLLAVPVLGRILEWLEFAARDRTAVRGLGAHLLVALRRLSAPAPG